MFPRPNISVILRCKGNFPILYVPSLCFQLLCIEKYQILINICRKTIAKYAAYNRRAHSWFGYFQVQFPAFWSISETTIFFALRHFRLYLDLFNVENGTWFHFQRWSIFNVTPESSSNSAFWENKKNKK